MFEHPVIQLPPQLTSFIGRTDEIVQISQQLDNPDCHLLTLVGPGGIGKTRLAIEVAKHILGAARRVIPTDGVYFVDLQPISTADSLVTTLANSIDMRFFGEQPPRVQLLNFLRDRKLLLLIDNFEHLLDGVDLLSEIVKTAPNVKMLVTSREALNVQEEWLWQVQGLQIPENVHVGSIENFSAVRLFVERACRVRADFRLANQENQVVHICRLVEGMPLALELAASWTKALSCDEIANELQRGIDFLKTNVRNMPERHRSMQAVFDQSWRMLTEAERAVFPKLSVFRGGFRHEAAEAVAGASLQTLAGLVDKSFLRVSQTGRHEIHELMRQYGEEQLNVEANDALHDCHCSYYARFLHEQEIKLRGRDQIIALDQIAEELDNIRVCWRWIISQSNRTAVEQCGYSLFHFGHIRMKTIESEFMFEQAVECLAQDESALLAYLLLAQQWYALENGKIISRESIHKAIQLLTQFTIQPEMAHALAIVCAGGIEVRHDKPEEVLSFLLQTLAHFRTNNEQWAAAWLLYCLGDYACYYHKYDEAKTYQEESRDIFKSLGDAWSSVWPMGTLAFIYRRLAMYREALLLLQERQVICEEIGDVYGTIWSLTLEGDISIELQDFGRAERCVIHSLEMILALGSNHHGLGDLLTLLPRILTTKESGLKCGVELLAFLHRDAQKMGADIYAEIYEETLNTFAELLSPEAFHMAAEQSKTRDLKTILTQLRDTLLTSAPVGNPVYPQLTERELEILRLIADGLQNQEIADQLFIALGTVKAHINAIYRKLDVANRVQAVSRARELKLL